MFLNDIAKALELPVTGQNNPDIRGLGPVHSATAGELTFVVGPKYKDALKATRASAVIVPEAMQGDAPCDVIVSDQPYLSYARVSQLLYPDLQAKTGLHPSAAVSEDVTIGADVSIGAMAVVESGATIGAGSVVGAGCYIGAGVTVGAGCRLFPKVTIYAQCKIGDACRIQSGAVIGSEGFGYARTESGWQRIQQVGRVLVGDRVEIGANTTIDRGALKDTVIADDVILDNQIQIAHNVHIGAATAIAACVGIAGSTEIGKNCTIGGKAAIVGHLKIADNVHLTATSFVTQSISEAGSYSSGVPLLPTRRWRRDYVRLGKLEELFEKVKKLTREPSSD